MPQYLEHPSTSPRTRADTAHQSQHSGQRSLQMASESLSAQQPLPLLRAGMPGGEPEYCPGPHTFHPGQETQPSPFCTVSGASTVHRTVEKADEGN